MTKKLRHALEIIRHDPTTLVVHVTGHSVMDISEYYIKTIYITA